MVVFGVGARHEYRSFVEVHITDFQRYDFFWSDEAVVHQFTHDEHLRVVFLQVLNDGLSGFFIDDASFLVCFLFSFDLCEWVAGGISFFECPVEEYAHELEVVVVASLADSPVIIYIVHKSYGTQFVECA